jgi:molecular chaperone DnaK
MSESRDLTVSAFLNGTGQEFSQVFDPKNKEVPVDLLSAEILLLEETIQREQEEARANGKRDIDGALDGLLDEVQGLMSKASNLSADDVTDDKFKLESKKREIAQGLFQLTSGKRLDAALREYRKAKQEAAETIEESGNDRERHHFSEIIAREPTFINSNNPERIEAATAEIAGLQYGVLLRTPDFLRGWFHHLNEHRASMNDQAQAKTLIDAGKRHILTESWDELAQVNSRLFDLLPDRERASEQMQLYTGIV